MYLATCQVHAVVRQSWSVLATRANQQGYCQTLHRAMTETDPDALQAATGRWLAARSPAPAALAADGKRHRGANRQSEAEYQTVSLVSHHDKQPIASRILTEKGGEIAAVLALLEEVDITGSVITLDALHTTRDTAAAILHSHRAHYLLSVKGNAPETYAALDTIDWDQDATASFCEEPRSLSESGSRGRE